MWLTGWQQERSAVDFLGQLLQVPPSLAMHDDENGARGESPPSDRDANVPLIELRPRTVSVPWQDVSPS